MAPGDTLGFDKLNESNYARWKGNMGGYLRMHALWRITTGLSKRPAASVSTSAPAAPGSEPITTTVAPDAAAMDAWEEKAEKAAGALLRGMEPDQFGLISEVMDDPKAMWDTLAAHYEQKRAATRFAAYEKLLSMEKGDDESLNALVMRAKGALTAAVDATPEGFTLAQLQQDLACMAIIRALPAKEFSSFRSLLLMKDELTLPMLSDALYLEQSNRTKPAVQSAAAMAAYAPSSSSSSAPCSFCDIPGHSEATCHKKAAAASTAKAQTAERRSGGRSRGNKGKQRANAASQDSAPAAGSISVPPATANSAEFAGNASNPPLSSLPTRSDWIADTGATIHMTPHLHWFRSYSPYKTPIRLADHTVIYSAGIGDVEFEPVLKNGKLGRRLVFQRVLHVPDLRSSLFSVLYMTRNKSFRVTIIQNCMLFRRQGKLLFTASVDDRNAACLDGRVVPTDRIESAQAVSTLPVDKALWHRRFAHLHHRSVEEIIRHKMVKGLVIQDSSSPPDPICEPCLAGKLHRGPISKVAQHRAAFALGLIHSDLHGPLPVEARQKWRYWITFICDYSRFWIVIPLRKKSDAFDAFKRFKAFAENQLNAKIKCLRDDKGGEYMSTEFDQYLSAAGIQRQHTVRNEPHQNGVAERANRTIGEGVTSLLKESRLPPSFWGYALNAFVYAHIRSPTAAISTKQTPFELWHSEKPDVSNLRIFGSAAYVHVQKDKRKGLQSHYIKCIFVGYPVGYKGWICYDPIGKREIVSDTVTFDERCIPGNSAEPIPDFAGPFDTADGPLTSGSTGTPGSGPDPLSESEDGEEPVGVDAIHHNAPPPLQPLPPADVRPKRPDDDVPKQESPPPSLPPSPSPSPPPSPPPRPPTRQSTRRFPVHQQQFPHPYQQAQQRRTSQRTANQKNGVLAPVPPGLPAPTRARSQPLATVQDDDELNLPVPTAPESLPGPSAHIEDISDDDELNIGNYALAEDVPDEVGDGHEDMDESHLKAFLADGLDHMQSEWVAMDVPQLLELVYAETALKADNGTPAPRTFGEAVSRPDGQHYLQAAIDEVKALVDNGTFIVRERLPSDRPIGSRWVFLVKRKADGSIERYKGRVVAQGFSQRPGFDFTDTWAPTAKMASIRAILATAGFEDWDIEQVDISSAFLNGKLTENITMNVFAGLRQIRPDLFPEDGSKDDRDWVLALERALYGLKQSPREWHKDLCKTMGEMGFKKIESDSSIFVFLDEASNTRVIAPVYVDDITITGKNSAKIAWVKAELRKRYKLRDLGPVEFLLGIHIIRDRPNRTIKLSQRQAIIDILHKFDMQNCSPVGSPLDPSVPLTSAQCPTSEKDALAMKQVPYREAVGSVMYLAIGTRPDIAHAVGVLSRFSNNPGMAHWTAVKHLLRYLKGTMDLKLTYAPTDSKDRFTTYSDADYGGEELRRSTSAYVIKMGTGAVSWASRLQTIQTLSTTEAEYVSAVSAAQEALWMRNLFMEFGYPIKTIPLHMDSQSGIAVAKNPEHHGRMKHLDLRFYWLRHIVAEGTISLHYIPTADMPADCLTKAFPKAKMDEARRQLGLCL